MNRLLRFKKKKKISGRQSVAQEQPCLPSHRQLVSFRFVQSHFDICHCPRTLRESCNTVFSGFQRPTNFPPVAEVYTPKHSRTILNVKELAMSQCSRVEPETSLWRRDGSSLSIFLQEEKEQFCKGSIQTSDFYFIAVARVEDIIWYQERAHRSPWRALPDVSQVAHCTKSIRVICFHGTGE